MCDLGEIVKASLEANKIQGKNLTVMSKPGGRRICDKYEEHYFICTALFTILKLCVYSLSPS